MFGEILMILILGPLALIMGLVVPFYLIGKISNFLYVLFPHINKEKISNVVTVTIVVIWVIIGSVLSAFYE